MAIKKKIITEALTKECWSANQKYNYGPIKFLRDKVLYAYGDYKKNFENYEKNIHRVTDAKTFFIYQLCSYDCIVDCTQLVCDMRRTFPKTSFEQVMMWIYEESESHHVLNFDNRIAPEKYQGMSIYQIFWAITPNFRAT